MLASAHRQLHRLPKIVAIHRPTMTTSCLLASLFFASPLTQAAEINTTAGVNLLLGLTLTENREVDFGILSGASAGSCDMATNGNMTGAVPGCTGSGTSGQFTIEGIRFFQVTVSVSPGSSEGITFTPDFGGTTTLSGFLPATFSIFGAATLNVGGTLSWGGTLSPGPKQIPFTFTADYN